MNARSDATGFVLAGGQGHRMGREKALLPWGKTTLLDHALSRLSCVCSRVVILSGDEPRYADRGVPVWADVVRQVGPIGGVLTGLLAMEHEIGVFLAADLPLVPAELLSHLLELVPGFDAVVPVSEGRPAPVSAVYRRSCVAAIRRRLERGQRAMYGFWPDVRVRRVGDREIVAFGGADIFRNLNTPAEYEFARAVHGS